MGEIVPLSCIPVLPGDTLQMSTNALVRMSPLNTPVMHPTQVRLHHFFVPNRLVWDQWEDFITGGPDGTSAPTIPIIAHDGDKKNVATYQGVAPITGFNFNAFAVRGYNLIYSEFYRDQDLIAAPNEDTTNLKVCSWEKDYFTTCRPWSQKGPDVVVPLGDTAPVISAGVAGPTFTDVASETEDWGLLRQEDLDSNAAFQNGFSGAKNGTWLDPGLIADLSQAAGVSVNDFRASFAIQRYQEARARYGSRFTEYLRYLGVNPADQRLQRPEWLGGGTTRLQFSEVLQTSAGKEQPDPGTRDEWTVGDMYGHGIAGVRSNRFRKFFQEHGFVHTLMSIRPKAMYVNATPREFIKRNKEDYFQKELANLGQQEVTDAELYGNNSSVVFGYQDRYQEYRYHPSQVAGDFRDTLNAYHMGRDLAASPVLNQSFVECRPTDRIFQVG